MIKIVTITGADNSVTPQDIANLAMDFPFSEWAILVSRSQQGGRRFPSIDWIKELIEIKKILPFNLSLHLCGAYVRELLIGDISFIQNELFSIWPYFERVQINTHGQEHKISIGRLIEALSIWPDKEFIFQYDEVPYHITALNEAKANNLKVSALFDLSHGAGVLPSEWPDLLPGLKCGYAGGISPENIAAQCEKVNLKVGSVDTWIDMETHVRSNNDSLFDLNKVDKCLSIAELFINPFRPMKQFKVSAQDPTNNNKPFERNFEGQSKEAVEIEANLLFGTQNVLKVEEVE